jgi:hypothetical protein
MCNDLKFDYSSNPAKRLYIDANRIRYIGKESNNLEENQLGIEEAKYLEYSNDHEILKSLEFKEWILSLKPKDVKNNGISQQALYYQKSLIKSEKHLNVKQKVARKLLELYKENKAFSKE